MMNKEKSIEALLSIDKELVLLSHINGVLVWDQESTSEHGKEERAQQIGLIERKIHEKATSDEMGEILTTLGASEEKKEGDADLPIDIKAIIRHRYHALSKEKKLSSSFVQHFSHTTSLAHETWVKARREDNYSLFAPVLEEIVSLIREKSDLYGYEDDPYDPLLDNFEPGMKTSEVKLVFDQLEGDLVQILERLRGRVEVEDSFLYQHYSEQKQELFSNDVLQAMGFDFKRGKVGISTHPYTISLGADDIRITTRYSEPSVTSPLYSIIHEGGHALYEMGVSHGSLKGTVLANASSLAFHESQSRLWENMIGRSRAFWKHFYKKFSTLFPTQLNGISEDQFYRAVNKVSPSPIRVDADEVTYSLHIMLRFNLERALLSGTLEVKDLKEAWNEGMNKLLGIEVKSDRLGVLQDVHWSMGEFAYFPTYALGNLYAAQIYHTMEQAISIDSIVESGDFSPIRHYLQENVYKWGALLEPKPLLEKITKEALNPTYYKEYLTNKYIKER
ncbi:MAG: carboxypeptidase M32 [Spirochaetia bacterium]|nr:carboxypeptidase M32 [Spirochaetia bacterium]